MVRDPSRTASSWRSRRSLDDALERQGIVGLAGIDTRALVRHLRERGAMKAGVFSGDALAPDAELVDRVRSGPSMLGADLYGAVTTPRATSCPPTASTRFRVAALDVGIKSNTPRMFAARGVETHVLPAHTPIERIEELAPDGFFLANGPGDPATADVPVALTRQVLERRIPLFGICFGNQILARALGRGTYKLRYGHRGINIPVIEHATGRVSITAQNHGFAVEGEAGERFDTPFGPAQITHTCPNDGCVEGLALLDVPAFSVQYHPEAAAGPHDAADLFDRFVELMERALMPRRDDLRHVLVIGSGPIVIGQAAEFDYSGTQACRVLRDEGLRVSLVNSNPATIMTDPEFADATYIEPITPEFVEKVIAAERPDAILATLGGQTALNTAIALHENGVLERYGVELIGADIDAIQRGEDRLKFKEIVQSIGGDVPRSAVCHSMDEVRAAVADLGLPVVIRPSFTMGGLGSGMAHTDDDLDRLAGGGLAASPVHRGAHRGVGARLEGVRARADARPPRQRRGRLLHREPRPDGRAHRRLDHRRPGDDADRPRVPAHARRRHRRAARRRRRHRRLQHPVRGAPGDRAPGRHRDEPAGVAVVGAGVQGHRLPDREDRGEAGRRVHPRRDPQRHHRRDAGRVRADAGLRRGQDAAVRVREVPRRRPRADHDDEERRRGDGARAVVRRGAGQGAALDGDGGRRVLDGAGPVRACPTSPPRPTGGSTPSSGCCGRA